MFLETRKFMDKIGLPPGDLHELPTSTKYFPDGSWYKIEIPTVNNIETAEAMLEEASRLNIKINRITETLGMFRHHKSEISKYISLCNTYGCELVMSTGPRATYDLSASAASSQGKTIAYRLRGQEQVIRAIEDIKRGIDLGVQSFLIYDEGLLWVLAQMRQEDVLPKSIKFKISAHCGHCNPASFKILETLGADSINPVRDLQLPMIAALRYSVSVPIDCHTDNPQSSGGFIRVYEAPEIVRIASPVYIKTGNSVVSQHGDQTTAKDGIRMARQAAIVMEMIDKYCPQAIQAK